jgi:hypothetical protein
MNQAFMLCALDSMLWDAKATVYFSAMAVRVLCLGYLVAPLLQ